MPNYSFTDPDLPDGSVINSGNFTQANPNTEIMVGKTLTINGGNFVNVKAQPGWTINGGNWVQVSRCSHLHPKLLEKGLITECPTECSHMINKDEIYIDGELMDTMYTYNDIVVKNGYDILR